LLICALNASKCTLQMFLPTNAQQLHVKFKPTHAVVYQDDHEFRRNPACN
jgi:hypothetical protein